MIHHYKKLLDKIKKKTDPLETLRNKRLSQSEKKKLPSTHTRYKMMENKE